MHQQFASTAMGAAALSAPIWLDYVSPAYQFVIAVLGLVVLVLTIREKWLGGKIKSAQLRDMKDRGDAE